jgi:hypothetical protein
MRPYANNEPTWHNTIGALGNLGEYERGYTMVTSTITPNFLDSALGDLVLKIRGSNHNGQVLRLKSAKCTIGSGPNCTLRLRSRGVDPLHCLILRGPNGAVIRRWSPDTRLNGGTFNNAPLSAGDRLSIGSLEFEIINTGEIAAPLPADTAPNSDRDKQDQAQIQSLKKIELESKQLESREKQIRHKEESIDLRTKELEQTATALRAEQNKFAEERRQWDELRNASLKDESRHKSADDEQLSRLKTQLAELESQKNTWTSQQNQWQAEQGSSQKQLQDSQRQIDERTAELHALSAELDARRAKLDAQASDLELHNSELTDQAAQLAAQTAKNNAYSGELDARSAQIEAHSRDLQTQTAELAKRRAGIDDQASELENQAAELKIKSAELDSQQSALETERNQWAEDRLAEEKNLNSREEEIANKAAQLETLQSKFHAEEKQWKHQLAQWERNCERWEAERAEKDSAFNASPAGKMQPIKDEISSDSEHSPAEPDDMLHRFGHDMNEPEENVDLAAYAPFAQSPVDQDKQQQATAHKSAQPSSANDEEESVDDYMVRLMQRIRGTQGEPSTPTEKPNVPAPSQTESAPLPFDTVPPVAEEPIYKPVQRGQSVELAPRSPAPENIVDINVFRDLANYSAQNALGTHARGQMMNAMYSKLAVALMGGFTGIGLLLVWQLWFPNRLTFFSAMMSFVVAFIWGSQYLMLTVRLLGTGSDNQRAMKTAHSNDKKLIVPDDQHAIPAIDGQEDLSCPESPEKEFKSKKSAKGSAAPGKHRRTS